MIKFSIAGEPARMTAQQKGVNWKRRAFYTKSQVKAERRRILKAALPHAPGCPFTGPVHCSIMLVFPLTQAQAAHHAEKLSTDFTLLHLVKPDVDNSAKLILDVLTEANFWADDAQVCDLNLHKRYGSNPRIAIAITVPASA